MPKSKAAGKSSKDEENHLVHRSTTFAYEGFCRSINEAPIPEVLGYAKMTEERERKTLDELREIHGKNPTAENYENLWRVTNEFPSSMKLHDSYMNKKEIYDEKKSKKKSK